MSLTSHETYSLAHTAQCKLKLSANRPDRNLRFLLGHAFTFDKIMLRIVEIESEQNKAGHKHDYDLQSCSEASQGQPRRVSFSDNSNRPSGDLRQETEPTSTKGSKRPPSPPPNHSVGANESGSDSSDTDEYVFDDEFDEEPGLGLTKTVSHAARPPPELTADTGDSDEEDDGPKSPPSIPSDEALSTITQQEGDEAIAELYETVRTCGCQKQVAEKAPAIERIWEIPQESAAIDNHGRRTAVVQVQA